MASEADIRVYSYPADSSACGLLRVIAPAEALARQGVDVTVVPQHERQLMVDMDPTGEVIHVALPPDADVVVVQRVTHRHLVSVLRYLRNHTQVATVLDIDDDLSAIAPGNPAFRALQPRPGCDHSWNYLKQAASVVNMVVVSSPALAERYAPHGRVRVVYNYLPDSYDGLAREDSATVGWPASLHSHPDDPAVTRGAIGRLVREGVQFRAFGDPEGLGRAFGLPDGDPESFGYVPLEEWPAAVARLGVGIAPLADTRFNQAKSFLKPLEMAAVGVPFVASPRTEYVRLHRMGAGLLAKKPQDWYRQVKRLVESPGLREELSGQGRAVAARLRLDDHCGEHLSAWQAALAHQRDKVAALA